MIPALLILLIAAVYGPSLWVRYVLWRHSKELDGIPGTGGELAQHLIERFELRGVSVREGATGEDFYNPQEKVVSLSPRVYSGRSLTAIAVATHEIGHAIQFYRDEPVSRLRGRYLNKALALKRLGTGLFTFLSFIAIILKIPHLFALSAIVAVAVMVLSAALYCVILPEEFDASFNKALPILKNGYVPEQHIPAIHSILRAAALTYVAAALANVLSLWRWFRILR